MMPDRYDDSAAASAASELHRLVRRLRALSPRAWRVGGRTDAVRALAVDLAALTAPGRSLPVLPDHALADAVAVLGADALDAGLDDRLSELVAAALAATR